MAEERQWLIAIPWWFSYGPGETYYQPEFEIGYALNPNDAARYFSKEDAKKARTETCFSGTSIKSYDQCLHEYKLKGTRNYLRNF